MQTSIKKTILALVILLILPQPSFAGDILRTISVTGFATKTVKAEYAVINTEIKVVSKSVEESYQSVTTLLSELATKLQTMNITKEELTVSIITQGSEYEWVNNSRTMSGYFSACSLQIKVNTIDNMYRIHEALAKYPNISIGLTEYGRKDESLLRTETLQEALLASQIKARALTETLGGKLGPVLNIRETGAVIVPTDRPSVQLSERTAAAPDEVSTTGSVTITGNISVDYEIR